MPFTLARHPAVVVPRRVSLAERTELAPGFVRLRLVESSTGELVGFHAPGSGDHFRMVVALDPQGRPAGASSTYTAVAWQVETEPRWVDLDVVLHDDHGAAAGEPAAGSSAEPRAGVARWAASAPIGAPAVIAGPKGSVLMTGRPERVLLAGDDTAVPALRRYLGMLGAGTRGDLLLETRHDPRALGLEVPAGVELSILPPVPHQPGAAIAAALTDRPRPLPAPVPSGRDDVDVAHDVFVFVCAEQSVVAPARALLARWGIPVESAVVKGYWKR